MKKTTLILSTALLAGVLVAESANPLENIPGDQNANVLFQSIPKELQNLDYAIYTSNKSYDTERFNFNKRFNVFPHAIFTPKSASEVAFLLKELRKNKLEFAIRSGGTSYEPASLSTGYIIDLRNFNAIEADTKKEEVYIGAGVRVGKVIETLGKQGFALPTSYCPAVGMGGLTLGGGVGPLTRSFGLTADCVKSITFMNANGEVLQVSQESNPDLFWALRGAGNGSFGIVLGFTFKMYPLPKVSCVELTFGDKWDTKVSAKAIKLWEKWTENLPDTINTQVQLIYKKGKSQLKVIGLKVGDDKFTEWQQAFSELTPTANSFEGSYLQAAERFAYTPAQPFQEVRSKFLMKPMTYDVIQTSVNYFENLEKTTQKFDTNYTLDLLGGKMAGGDSAFFARKAVGLFHMEFLWDDEVETPHALWCINEFFTDISNFTSKYSYVNALDYDLTKNVLETYHGENVERLIEIKTKYDPENVFHFKHSIPTKGD